MRRTELALAVTLLLPVAGQAVELGDLVRQAVADGKRASGILTGKSMERIVQLTKATGGADATVEVLGPLPTESEICRQLRIVFYVRDVATKDGKRVPFTQTLDMPWCPSQRGYAALKGTPGLFRIGR